MKKSIFGFSIIAMGIVILVLVVSIITGVVIAVNTAGSYKANNYDFVLGGFSLYKKSKPDKPKTSLNLNDVEQEAVNQIYEKVTEYYDLDREAPTFKVMSDSEMQVQEGGVTSAIYVPVLQTVYLSENFMDDPNYKSHVAHEICHYLSDPGLDVVDGYVLEDKYVIGRQFWEGLTNYFSCQVYPDESGMYYIFETPYAKAFADCMGEKEARKAFFSHDNDAFRDFFNSKMKDVYPEEKFEDVVFTPFDVFCANEDWYGGAYVNVSDNEEEQFEFVQELLSITNEEIAVFSRICGKEFEIGDLKTSDLVNEKSLDKILTK